MNYIKLFFETLGEVIIVTIFATLAILIGVVLSYILLMGWPFSGYIIAFILAATLVVFIIKVRR